MVKSILILLIFSASFFLGGKFFAYAQDDNSEVVVDEEKEKEIEETEEDIEKIEDKLKKEQREKEGLEKNLNSIQSIIYQTQKEIEKTNGVIEKTENTIERKEKEIEVMDKKIKIQKELLRGLVQETYKKRQHPVISILLTRKSAAELLGEMDRIVSLKGKLTALVGDIRSSREKIEKEKQELKEETEEHEDLLELKEAQQQTLISQKSQAQVKVSQKESDIQALRSKLIKLRSNLSSLLGKSFEAGDIEEAAKFASKATGVRKDFIMGMLVVESDLGRYTGGCNYKESRMSDYRKAIFKEICEELDYNYKKQKVSCPPSGYKGTGGAMGVAQFMSDTWRGYEDRIASLTGHNPPDPWNLTDGVTAMAIKLGNDGATSKSGECKAAMRYLGGSHQWYCDRVLYWAKNYEDKLY